MGSQKTILKPAADGHDLRKQFICTFARKITVSQSRNRLKLLLLPLPVINRLSGLYLILSHLSAQLHTCLKQLCQAGVNHIQLLPDLL